MPTKPSSRKPEPKTFVGRGYELARFREIFEFQGPKIVVVYGRRRVGKTTLVHKATKGRKVYFFEGLQGQGRITQLRHFVDQLAATVNDSQLSRLRIESWREAFLLLDGYTRNHACVIYLEEVQWMADYRDELVSDLKFVWDNYFQKNRHLTVVVCGSSPSFLIRKVMQSKALHNRSQWEMPVKELPFADAIQLLGHDKSPLEQLDGYLAVGGIPEYLNMLNSDSSVYLSLTKNAFSLGGYFVHEADRVFVSSLADRPGYRAVIELLAKKGPLTKSSILKSTGNTSGGGAKDVFEDLELCGFIYPYSPIGLGKVERECKWMICDPYLQLYFRLIAPKLPAIQRGEFNSRPSEGLSHTEYRKWLGLAFERFCLFHHRQIASVLGFVGVEYRVGPYYQRNHLAAGQLDLVFDRKDRVTTVCKIKYQINPPSGETIMPLERAIQLLPSNKQRSIQKVLISPNGAAPPLVKKGYFDQIIDWKRLRTCLAVVE